MKFLSSVLRHAFGAGSRPTVSSGIIGAGAPVGTATAAPPAQPDPENALRQALQRKGADDVASTVRWADMIVRLASRLATRSVLDYGCGSQHLAVALVPRGLSVHGYDPTVRGLDAPPPEPFDFVVCTNLLQHVDPTRVGDVLAHLAICTRKAALITVALKPSQPPSWWQERLGAVFDVLDLVPTPDSEFAVLVAGKDSGVTVDFAQLADSAGSALDMPSGSRASDGAHGGVDWLMYGLSPTEPMPTSHLASHRYRALLPAQALRARGHAVGYLHMAAMPEQVDSDVVVITKLAETSMTNFRRIGADVLAFAGRLRRQGVAVVVDVSDNFFDRPGQADYWRALVRDATLCTVASDVMGEVVRRFTDAPVRVIGDPLGSPRGIARVFGAAETNGNVARPLSLVWYGNVNNFQSLQGWADQLAPLANRVPFRLTVITAAHPTIDQWIGAFNERHGPDATAAFEEWSEARQWDGVAAGDVVLIPSDPTNPDKLVKSANRLTDALHAGRYIVASPVPSYRPYQDFTTLTDQPLQAIEWYLQHGDEALRRITAGQRLVVERCSDAATAEAWHDALDAARRIAAADPARGSDPVRLNLGCGDKILSGYINVDVAPSRAGHRPDVLCDLRALQPFEAQTADEVMAIHVVEHFWRWEIEAVLREWVRVLKPGGRLIVECPNLEYACREFLRDPDQGARADGAGQLTMWVFYGDPRWKDPLMIHRWGYTPESLAALLRDVGLTDVRQVPAQFKKREPRDMRVIGTKPAAT